MNNKSILRKIYKEKRKNIDFISYYKNNILINKKIKNFYAFKNAKKIAFYFSKNNEINLNELIIYSFLKKKICYFPKIINNNLYLSKLFNLHGYKIGKFLIKEPKKYSILHICNMDIIFIPLVVFDKKLNRIGMGKGFYDKLLSNNIIINRKKPLLIGISHSIQQTNIINNNIWDKKLNIIFTEKDIFY